MQDDEKREQALVLRQSDTVFLAVDIADPPLEADDENGKNGNHFQI